MLFPVGYLEYLFPSGELTNDSDMLAAEAISDYPKNVKSNDVALALYDTLNAEFANWLLA